MADNDDYMVAKATNDQINELMWDRLQEGINANRRFRLRGVVGGDGMEYDTTKLVWDDDIYIYFTRESDGAWVRNKINANPTTGVSCGNDDILYVVLNDITDSVLTMMAADYTTMPTDDTGRILIFGAVVNATWYGNIIGGAAGWENPAVEDLDMGTFAIINVGNVDGKDVSGHVDAVNPHTGSASTTDLTNHTTDVSTHNKTTIAGMEDLHTESHVLATTGPHSAALPISDLSNYVQGNVIIGGGSVWSALPLGTENYVLKAGASQPSWGQVDWSEITSPPSDYTPSSHVLATTGPHSGSLPLADIAGYAQGRIIIGDGSDWTYLTLGTENYVLKAGSSQPAWGQVAWGEVQSKPSTFPPSGHASAHTSGGSDAVNHDALTNFDADEHIDWKSTTEGISCGRVKVNSTTRAAGELYSGTTDPVSTNRMNYDGHFYATKVYNAVYNDFADYWGKLPEGEKPVHGRVYVACGGKNVKIADKRADSSALGICSDTYGFASGQSVGDVPLAVAGFVLAYVDKEYEPGTRLVNDDRGGLTRAEPVELFKVIAKFVTKEKKRYLNTKTERITVNGRCWVKVI